MKFTTILIFNKIEYKLRSNQKLSNLLDFENNYILVNIKFNCNLNDAHFFKAPSYSTYIQHSILRNL